MWEERIEQFGASLEQFLSVNSIGSILVRAGIWFVVAIVIIAATDTTNRHRQEQNLKAGLGALLLFFLLCGGLIYLMFGFVPIT